MPPFDDVHVRKAVNWALDKEGYAPAARRPAAGEIAGHIILTRLLGNLLRRLRPVRDAERDGRHRRKAKEEMAQSKYDTDGDGVCDDPSCEDILTITDRERPVPEAGGADPGQTSSRSASRSTSSSSSAARHVRQVQRPRTPTTAFCPARRGARTTPTRYTFGVPLFDSSGLVGRAAATTPAWAPPRPAAECGYDVDRGAEHRRQGRGVLGRRSVTNGSSAGPSSTSS